MGVIVTKDNMPALRKALDRLRQNDVLIGVPDTTAGRPDAKFNNASIGYVNETGSPVNNIPPRPHLVPGVASIGDAATQRMKTAAAAVLDGRPDAADNALIAVGLMGQNSVRGLIKATLSPALAESTIYARKHRMKAPREGEKPLYDTGGYLVSIIYVIRKSDRN